MVMRYSSCLKYCHLPLAVFVTILVLVLVRGRMETLQNWLLSFSRSCVGWLILGAREHMEMRKEIVFFS